MRTRKILWLVVVVVAVALASCKKAAPTAVAETGTGDLPAGGPGGLGGMNGLALGTLRLEGSEEAVTPVQAAELLPLWQMIEGGSLQGAAETEAVLKQIEAKMTEAQLAAIEGMELTWQDMQSWMEEQGIEMPAPPQGQQGGGGAFRTPGGVSEEERAKLREEFQNMTQEQRATRMAEMGIERPEGGAPPGGPGGFGDGQGGRPGGFGGRGGGNFLVEPLIELLSERAAE